MFYKGYLISKCYDAEKCQFYWLIHTSRFNKTIIGKTDFPSQAINVIESFHEFDSKKREIQPND